MRSPPLVPQGFDFDVYIVLDDYGELGRAYRETDEEQADRSPSFVACLSPNTTTHPALSASTPREERRAMSPRKSRERSTPGRSASAKSSRQVCKLSSSGSSIGIPHEGPGRPRKALVAIDEASGADEPDGVLSLVPKIAS